MPNRIETAFNKLNSTGSKAFIPFTVLGYPDRETSLRSIEAMIENGATMLELGLPFSDPMADGPLIENAAKSVVESGFTTGDAMDLIKEIRTVHREIPIVIMSYFNLAMARGIEQFIKDLKDAGVDGITFVDLPPEEGAIAYQLAIENCIAPIMLVSPLTSEDRLNNSILGHARGYLYVVSRAGITGLSEKHDNKLQSLIAMLKENSKLPVCIGFGISKPEHVEKMLKFGADGVVVGSKLVEHLAYEEPARAVRSLAESVKALARAARKHEPIPAFDFRKINFKIPS